MEYFITWTEGEEVCYRFVSEDEIQELMEEDKKYIVAGLPFGKQGETPPSTGH